MKYLYAFLGGALVGAAASLLTTPQKGEDLRNQIRDVLRKHGLLQPQGYQPTTEEIVEQIVAEIQAEK